MSAVLPPSLGVPAAAREAASMLGSGTSPSVVDAIGRLALSRERLRDAMLPPPRRAHHGAPGESMEGLASFASHLLDRVKALPIAAVLIDAIESWWAQHPLRTAASVAAEASRKLAEPIAERNPMMLLLGAFLFGAVVVLTRPWRWMLRPVLFAGLIPALATRAIRELSVDSLVDMFAWYSAPPSRANAARTDPPPCAAEAPSQAAAQARTSAR